MSPLQSSIYILGFLLTSDRTDTRTRACGTAKSFENLKITFYIVVGENRYTCRNGQKCVCTITHVRNAPGYAAVTVSSSRIGDIFPRFNQRVRNRQNFGESNLRSIVVTERQIPLVDQLQHHNSILSRYRAPFCVSTTYDELVEIIPILIDLTLWLPIIILSFTANVHYDEGQLTFKISNQSVNC